VLVVVDAQFVSALGIVVFAELVDVLFVLVPDTVVFEESLDVEFVSALGIVVFLVDEVVHIAV
jgi:hypothetical protein